MTVLRGNLIAIAIGFLALPVLSRLFPPEGFGILQSTQSILTLLLVAASLRYEIPLLMTRGTMELKSLLTLNLLVNLGVSAAVALAVFSAIAMFPHQTAPYRAVLVIAPFWILAASIMQTLSYVVLRQHAFGAAATAKITQATGTASAGLLLGLLWPITAGLLLADLIGRLASVFVLLRRSRTLILAPRGRRTRRAVSLTAFRYRNFPQISLPSAMVNSSGGVLVPVLMLLCLDVHSIGQFALVDRSIGVFLALVAQSVSQVFMGSFAQALRGNGEDPLAMFRRTILLLFALAIIPTLVMMAILPWLFGIVFGPNWALAGQIAVVLAPFYLIGFVVTPVNTGLLILERQRLQFIWDIARTIGVIAIWAIAGQLDAQPIPAILAYGTFVSAAYLAYLYMCDKAIRKHIKDRIKIPQPNP